MAEHRGGSGNFAENREKASEAGRKGGQHSGGNFKKWFRDNIFYI
ncbi:general stress protein, partial [Salmonella enterica]